jgi:putative hydrolase of the HAD superfamily
LIELILFDYGGVLAPEGFQLGILKLAQEFNKSFEEMYQIAGYQAGLETGYTSGKITEKDYWKSVEEKVGIKKDLMPYRDVFQDNFQPRKDMLGLVKELRKRYKTGIFSDQTNWLHELNEKYDFFKYFDHIFISYDLGCTKHDDEFYRIPPRLTKIEPSKILVVDDKPRVVKRIIGSGMKAYRFISVDSCVQYLTGLAE